MLSSSPGDWEAKIPSDLSRRPSPYERFGIVLEEKKPRLIQAAKKYDALMLGVVAPLFLPPALGEPEVRAETIAISEEERMGLDHILGRLEPSLPPNLLLLLETRGGSGAAAYTMARLLRLKFREIKVFIPHQALSAGTLIAVAADEIVMDQASNLGPLDAQVELPGYGLVSASRLRQGLLWTEEYYRRHGVFDSKTFLREKIDPVIYGLLEEAQRAGETYLKEILKLARYPPARARRIAHKLVWEFPSHEFPITIEKAKELGLRVVDGERYPGLWKLMEEWLDRLAFHPKNVDHILAYAAPK